MLIADYSYEHPDPNALRAAGVDGVARYVTGALGSKRLTVKERDALWTAGLPIALVFEATASAALGGSAAGIMDARDAQGAAELLGWPTLCPIYFTVDFNPTIHEVSAVVAYFRGLHSAHFTYPVGAYGSSHVLDVLHSEQLARVWWQTSAWSQGAEVGYADMYQHRYDVHIGGGVVDLSDTLTPNWGGHHPPPNWHLAGA